MTQVLDSGFSVMSPLDRKRLVIYFDGNMMTKEDGGDVFILFGGRSLCYSTMLLMCWV